MSMVCFYVGKKRCVIDTIHILRILPYVVLGKIKRMPFFIAGFLNLSGKLIPVIDFCELLEKRKTDPFFHSRIMLLEDPDQSTGQSVGLLAEKMTEMIKVDSDEYKKIETSSSFPFLEVLSNDRGESIYHLNTENFFKFLSCEIYSLTEFSHD